MGKTFLIHQVWWFAHTKTRMAGLGGLWVQSQRWRYTKILSQKQNKHVMAATFSSAEIRNYLPGIGHSADLSPGAYSSSNRSQNHKDSHPELFPEDCKHTLYGGKKKQRNTNQVRPKLWLSLRTAESLGEGPSDLHLQP